MVEDLLQRGADPNLILPEGIAAIHLAAGMEQESGTRCLSLILQYGGDPNVRYPGEASFVEKGAGRVLCSKFQIFHPKEVLGQRVYSPPKQQQQPSFFSNFCKLEGSQLQASYSWRAHI